MLEDIRRFFEGLWNRIRSGQKKISPFVIIVCILVITVPTMLAVYYAYFYDDGASLSSNSIEVNLYGEDGTLIFGEKVMEADIEGSSLVELLYNINVSKTLTQAPEDLPEKPNYSFKFKINSSETEFFCYFSDSAQESYIKDQQNRFFSINENDYNAFLLSRFSEGAYKYATPPSLITANGDSVTPTSVKWSYKAVDGSERQLASPVSTEHVLTYTMGGAVSLYFESTPSSCDIIIRSADGTEIFNGSLEDLHYVAADTGALLRASITARWDNSDKAACFGEQTYRFNIILGERSEFKISSAEIGAGHFLMITATNVDDANKIRFSVSEATEGDIFVEGNVDKQLALKQLFAYKPKFALSGTLAKALIPFPINTPSGKYSVTVSFGAATESFEITVIPEDSFESYTVEKSFEEISPYVSDSAETSLKELLASTRNEIRENSFLSNSFASPEELGFTQGYSFGSVLSTADGTSISNAIGSEYRAATGGGMSVPSLNGGTVISAGFCQRLGNYVIVDHGFGLRTWYCLLSSVDVTVGDVLAKGQSVGKCGTAGPISASGFLLMCTVTDVIVDPSGIILTVIDK